MDLKTQFSAASFLFFVTASPAMADESVLSASQDAVFCVDTLSRALDFNRSAYKDPMVEQALENATFAAQKFYGLQEDFMAALLESMVSSSMIESDARKTMMSFRGYSSRFEHDTRRCVFAYAAQ